jgi:hypothetical protein
MTLKALLRRYALVWLKMALANGMSLLAVQKNYVVVMIAIFS